MNIEEAKKILERTLKMVEPPPPEEEITRQDILDDGYYYYNDEDLEAIECLLNELDKNTETISDLQNEVTIKDAKIERLKEYEYMYKDLCN